MSIYIQALCVYNQSYNMWILTYSQTNQKVFAHADLERAKFLQLLVSKHFNITVDLGNDIEIPDSKLKNILTFVDNVLSAELDTIELIKKEREIPHLAEKLLATKKFYSIVYPDDEIIPESIDLEIDEVNGYKESCNIHRNFVINCLYNIDYSADLIEIRNQFKRSIYTPPNDQFNVYEVLNPELAKVIFK